MKTSFKSYVKAINKELENIKDENIVSSCKYIAGKLRQKIKNENLVESGNLLKGVKYSVSGDIGMVGYGKPAYHAHLIEFGTIFRKRKSDGVYTGRTKANPILQKTFLEENEYIQRRIAENFKKIDK